MRLGLRLRTDLLWRPYDSDRDDRWVAQDPVRGEFYYFNALEKAIAISVDGKRSIDAIVQSVRSIDSNVTSDFVMDLIRRLDSASLLLHRNWTTVDVRNRPRTPSVASRIGTIMSYRIPVWNPSKTLHTVQGAGWLFFHPWVMLAFSVCVLVCAGFMLQRWQEIQNDVAAWPISLRGDRLLLLSALLLAIKGLHELGHAFACHWVGGNCREIGIMFFFGIPCLYCDVSDVWKVPNRWQRILVSAAGIYIELLVAMAASLVWLNMTELWVQAVSLQVIVVCTIVTIGFNANPLLRYDGYYILSDLVRVPNLADQSRESWGALWRSWLTKQSDGSDDRTYYFLALFHVVSWCYRWFLMTALVLGVHRWLVMQKLPESAAVLTGGFAIALTWLGFVSWRSNRAASVERTSFSWARIVGLLILSILFLVFLCTWRFEKTVFARGTLEPVRMIPVYAKQAAILTKVIDDGAKVKSGQTILSMESPELEHELILAHGDLQAATQRSVLLADRGVNDTLAAQQIEELSKVIQGLQERVNKLKMQGSQLSLISPFDGQFIDGLDVPSRSDFAGNAISGRWTLDRLAKDRGTVERGQLVGLVIEPHGWQVRAFVSETEVKECNVGASVRVRIDQSARHTVPGLVKSISAESLRKTPKALRSDILFGSEMSFEQDLKPEHTTYSVLIELETMDRNVVANGLASVRILTGQTTIIESIWESITYLVYQARGW